MNNRASDPIVEALCNILQERYGGQHSDTCDIRIGNIEYVLFIEGTTLIVKGYTLNTGILDYAYYFDLTKSDIENDIYALIEEHSRLYGEII